MKSVSNTDNLDNSDDSKNQKLGFMFYRNNLEDTIVEWCPNCCYEVNIKNKAEKQTCPVCGEDILPCSLCNHNYVNCNKCTIK